ncbi:MULTISPECIES: HAD family hydrolase [unclassified Pantoea]|uniref:HAD family hydrolase n=1 Tax=unclassified Pantoea TaxID=2630326 RepID=UPI0035C02F1E
MRRQRNGIRCIVFDFGGTLAEQAYSPSVTDIIFLLKVFYKTDFSSTFIANLHCSHIMAEQEYKETGTPTSWASKIYRACHDSNIMLSHLIEFESYLWNHYPDGDISNSTRELLQRLYNSGFIIFLACNTRRPAIQRRKTLMDAGVYNYFQSDVISTDIGKGKPHDDFYSAVISKIHDAEFKCSETIFVGNSYERDVIGPKKFGMNAVLVDQNNNPFCDTIDNIAELDKYLVGYSYEEI